MDQKKWRWLTVLKWIRESDQLKDVLELYDMEIHLSVPNC